MGTLLCPYEVKIIKGRLLLILVVNVLLLGSPTLAPPGGAHGYSFGANRATGSGLKTVTTTNVMASDPEVSEPPPTPEPTVEPTSVPTPEPTSVPTPEPTPVPTPEPTPRPTLRPTPSPTLTSAPLPTVSPAVGASPTTLPHSGSPTPTGSQAASASESPSLRPDIASTAPGTTNGRGGDASILGPNGKLAGPLGTWLATTAGGLALFILLLPRRREKPQQVLAEGRSFASAQPTPQPADPPRTEEKRGARWLRRSLQAAHAPGSVSAAPSAKARRSRRGPRTPRDL